MKFPVKKKKFIKWHREQIILLRMFMFNANQYLSIWVNIGNQPSTKRRVSAG